MGAGVEGIWVGHTPRGTLASSSQSLNTTTSLYIATVQSLDWKDLQEALLASEVMIYKSHQIVCKHYAASSWQQYLSVASYYYRIQAESTLLTSFPHE